MTTINETGLINFIQHDLLLNRPTAETLSSETNLITSGIIDSLSLIQLVTYLEKQTGIEIEDADVNPDNFQSVAHILNYIKTHVTEGCDA